MVRKTVFFEEAYGVNMSQVRSIEEIDTCIEKRIGRKLQVVAANSNIIDKTGNVLIVRKHDIDGRLDRALKR